MEAALGVTYNQHDRLNPASRALVRYADDFCVFCETQADAEVAKAELNSWLAERGLTLSEEKTRNVHLTDGFDFLGFNIRLYQTKNSRYGYKLFIKPSKASQLRLWQKLREEWRALGSHPVLAITRKLNPIIRGWANYFRIGVAKRVFSKLDNWQFHRTIRYAKRKHPIKSWQWLQHRYWGQLHPQRNDQWIFGDKAGSSYLLKFVWFKIERHVLVRGRASPDDPQLRDYWQKRQKSKASDLKPSQQKLARNQNYLCPLCQTSLFNEEALHEHHLEPKAKGGTNLYSNLRLVHLYCHQQIHSGKATSPTAKALLHG